MNSNVRMQLLDLAKTLTRRPELQLDMSYHSRLIGGTLTLSQFWADYPFEQQLSGYKSEVFLHCIGGISAAELASLNAYVEYVRNQKLPLFSKQLFALFEQLRRESSCKRLRPGTVKTFKIRHQLLIDFFRKQISSELFAGAAANALFSAIYLRLMDGDYMPPLPDALYKTLSQIDAYIQEVRSVTSLQKVAELVESIMVVIRQNDMSDMTRSYFSIESVASDAEKNKTTDALTVAELEQSGQIETKETNDSTKQDQEADREKLPTWHRETEQTSPTFLQFELENGTDSHTLGGTMRETDPGDQALALVQGSTSLSKRSEFSKQEAIDRNLTELIGANAADQGNINRFARAIWKFPERTGVQELEKYQTFKQQVWAHKQKLTRTIQMTLEQKRTGPRSDLLYGRLDRKLLRAVTDGTSRLFYKKRSAEPPLDAAFLLLVDCSASMQDKMEQTKLAITLFHESLTSLRIPHSIIGFWEDADNVTEFDNPNVFQVITDFQSSLMKNTGPAIVRLQAQQDNRDGFAIRTVSKYLTGRQEKNKVLLVFSDGEPAAAGYNDNGILDATEAVNHARRSGVEVVGLYLANESIQPEEAGVMQQIYGRSSVIVPGVDRLSEMLGPVLRKLLLKHL